MFGEYEIVRSLAQVGKKVTSGTRGVIVMVYPAEPPGYEVEFFDEAGNTLAVETVDEKQIERWPA